MTPEAVLDVGRDAMYLTMLLSAPLLLSALAVAKYFPSGLKATVVTFAVCSTSETFCPLSTSHTMALPAPGYCRNGTRVSVDPVAVAKYLPSGLKVTQLTSASCCRCLTSCPLLTSHMRAVLSKLPVARYLPSGLKSREDETLSCLKHFNFCQLSVFQRQAKPSPSSSINRPFSVCFKPNGPPTVAK